MECLICFGYIRKSCIGSCNHHFCYDCLIKWCAINNVCPKCKCLIREIRLDPEFDNLLGILNSEFNPNKNNVYVNDALEIEEMIDIDLSSNSSLGVGSGGECDGARNKLLGGGGSGSGGGSAIKEIFIEFPVGSNIEAGISLANNRGPGVKIVSLERDGAILKAGIKINDIIISLNNVPCVNHKQAIDIINYNMLSNKTLKCTYIETCHNFLNRFIRF
jgi:hypothetical protein